MDALTLLNDNLDVMKVLEHYDFDEVHESGATIRSACKIHGGKQPTAFVINVSNGLWFCHSGDCGGGDVYTLVQKLEGCNFKEAVKRIAEIHGQDINDLSIKNRKKSYVKEMQSWIETMNKRTNQTKQNEYKVEEEIISVTKFRDFKQETLEHFNVGFIKRIELEKSSGSTYELKDRLIIPIIQDDTQIGISMRKTKAKDYPKWSHQPVNIKTSNLLYNYDATHAQQSIVIVEGAFDVWAYHEIGIVAVATYGAHISNGQYEMLIKSGADLVWSFDGDSAGEMATNKAQELFRHKANMSKVIFDEGEDPASISREELYEKYKGRVRIW